MWHSFYYPIELKLCDKFHNFIWFKNYGRLHNSLFHKRNQADAALCLRESSWVRPKKIRRFMVFASSSVKNLKPCVLWIKTIPELSAFLQKRIGALVSVLQGHRQIETPTGSNLHFSRRFIITAGLLTYTPYQFKKSRAISINRLAVIYFRSRHLVVA